MPICYTRPSNTTLWAIMSLVQPIRQLRGVLSLSLGALALGACAHGPTDTLYQRLGGLEQITRIVSDTIDLTARDPRSRRSFEGINLVRTKTSVATHLCAITGGPCKYEGDSMPVAHGGMQITSAEFDLMDGYLAQVLDRRGIDPKAKAELQAILGPMKKDVVGQ